jgi:hypothetical protein
MRKYQHATKNEIETLLLRNNKIKTQPELFSDIYDIDGNIVETKNITRQNELAGAGIEYVTSYVEYVCTHFKDSVDDKSRFYYEAPPIEWAAFLDIVTGGITGQRERAEIAIMHLHAKPKPVLVQSSSGHLLSMQPFIITFDWGRPEELDAKAVAQIARLNKNKDNKKRLPIDSISILFSKPLFEDFFRKGAGSYSFPVGMYAKFFSEANDLKKSLAENQTGYGITDEILEVDQDTYISAYTRFARYIMLHNNLTGKELKNKMHYSTIHFDLYKTLDFLNQVYPSAISTNGRGERRVDMPKFTKFLANSIALYRIIPNFQLYPVLEHIDRKGFRLGIYTTMKAADEADEKRKR